LVAIVTRLPVFTGDATRRGGGRPALARRPVRDVAIAGALYWVAAGIVLAIVGAVASTWVLLVEILR
jgi:hypothetical protein